MTKILEYGQDCLVLGALKNKSMLHVTSIGSRVDVKVTEIKPESAPNDNRQWISLMPGYEAKNFPYFIVSGKHEFSIGNLVTNEMQTLIQNGNSPYFAQPGALFLPSKTEAEKNTVRMIFSSQHTTYANR